MRLLITIERCDWSHWRFKFSGQVGTGISYYTTWPVGGQAETYIEFPGQEFVLGPFSVTAGQPGFWQRAWFWLRRRRWPQYAFAHLPLRRSSIARDDYLRNMDDYFSGTQNVLDAKED